MSTFNHTPNNLILINSSSFTLSFFLSVEPAYALPVGAISQYYKQTVVRSVSNGINGYNLTIPWGVGDGYIANEATYNALYATYLNSFITLSQAKTKRINELLVFAGGVSSGNVIVSANQYFSDASFLSKLINEDLSYTRIGLPGSYYVNDHLYNHVTIATLGALEAIIDRIVELQYLTDKNVDTHRTNINALTTVTNVQAYDFSSGWQTVPY